MMNSIDRKLCEETAEFWLENGGDAEGFVYVTDQLYKAIMQKEKEQQKGSGETGS